MKRLIIVLSATLLFFYCSNNTTTPNDDNGIIGQWQWVLSYGGFANQNLSPALAGYSLSYIFYSDFTVDFAKNDSIIFKSKYRLYGDTVEIDSLIMNQIVSIENDQLILTEICEDCFVHTYQRKFSNSFVIIIDDFALIDLKGDPLQINYVSIKKDVLIISVSYSGGCKEHEFGLFAGRAFMKSLPPQSQLVLAHNANNDDCEAWITETLNFNLSPLKREYQKLYGDKGSILLRLATASDSSTFKPWPLYSF